MAVYAAYRHIELDKIGYGKKRTMKPSPSGGGESRDIFGAEGSGLPGHHRIAQPPGGFCHELFGSQYSGLPSHHRIAQPPGGRCNDQLFEPEYSGPPSCRQRVLKPPGGGSSDIFGADAVAGGPAQPAARRNNRNQSQLQSSMFADMMETKSKSGKDSHSRLFGREPPSPPPASKSQDTRHEEDESYSQARDSRRNPINHDGMTEADCTQSFSNNRRADRKPDGNPVTGEGYAVANGVKEMSAVNGTAQPMASAPPAAPKANGSVQSAPPSRPGRVPPGGFSSGLW